MNDIPNDPFNSEYMKYPCLWRPQIQKRHPPSQAKHDSLSAIRVLSSLKITALRSTEQLNRCGPFSLLLQDFFHQTLSVNANPLDLFDQPLLLDMIFLGTPQLRGGVNIFIFFKVSFEKHPNGDR